MRRKSKSPCVFVRRNREVPFLDLKIILAKERKAKSEKGTEKNYKETKKLPPLWISHLARSFLFRIVFFPFFLRLFGGKVLSGEQIKLRNGFTLKEQKKSFLNIYYFWILINWRALCCVVASIVVIEIEWIVKWFDNDFLVLFLQMAKDEAELALRIHLCLAYWKSWVQTPLNSRFFKHFLRFS